jgi:tetratricopeptide (TPR) repeat protein
MQYLPCFRLITPAFILTFLSIAVVAQGGQIGFSRHINGQVRFADSRTPAENVIIRLESTSGGLNEQVMTDRTGKFSFSGLRGEQFRVTAHLPGYVDAQETVELLTLPTGYINFQLVRDRSAVRNDLPPGVISAAVPSDAQSEYAKGKELMGQIKEAKTKEAVRHLEKAIAIYPAFFEAHLTLGLAQMDLNEWAGAEKELLAAIALQNQAATAYVALGDVYRQQKKYAEAEKPLLEGLKYNPDLAEGHAMLALLYWEMARSENGEQAVRERLQRSWIEVSKALKIRPSLAESQLLAGNLLMKARRGADALEHFEEYLRLEPKGSSVDEVRAMVLKLKQALAENGKNPR